MDIYTFSISLPPHPSDSKCKFASTAWSASKRDPGKGWCKPPSHLTCGVFTTFLTPKFLERQDCMLLHNSTHSIFIRLAIFLWLFEPQCKNFSMCLWIKVVILYQIHLSPLPSPLSPPPSLVCLCSGIEDVAVRRICMCTLLMFAMYFFS